MFSFAFGVLGSVLFWVVYFVITFIVVSQTLKRMAPLSFTYITTGERNRDSDGDRIDPGGAYALLVWHLLLWPLFLVCFILKWLIILIFPILLGNILKGALIAANNLVPTVEIKKKE